MHAIHPIGTAIEVEKSAFVVSGYRLCEKNDMASLAYLLVPYPLGYLDDRSFCTMVVDTPHKTLADGYADEATIELSRRLGELADRAKKAKFEDVMLLAEAFNQYLEETPGEDATDE